MRFRCEIARVGAGAYGTSITEEEAEGIAASPPRTIQLTRGFGGPVIGTVVGCRKDGDSVVADIEIPDMLGLVAVASADLSRPLYTVDDNQPKAVIHGSPPPSIPSARQLPNGA